MTADRGIINGMLTRQLDEIIHQAVKELFAITKSTHTPIPAIENDTFTEAENPSKNTASQQDLFSGLNDILFCNNSFQGRLELLETISRFIGEKLQWLNKFSYNDTNHLKSQCHETLDKAFNQAINITKER